MAPIRDVPTTALVVVDRLCFDALTFCEVVHATALSAQATTNASLVSCIAQLSDCLVGCRHRFGSLDLAPFPFGLRKPPDGVEGRVDDEDKETAHDRPQPDL